LVQLGYSEFGWVAIALDLVGSALVASNLTDNDTIGVVLVKVLQ
jgi:hypothetical protein